MQPFIITGVIALLTVLVFIRFVRITRPDRVRMKIVREDQEIDFFSFI